MAAIIDEEQYDYLFKIVLIGDSGVGKSNLLSRFTKNQFTIETKPTIGVEFATNCIKFNSKVIKAQIWDTAGQERFRALTSSYYKGAMGVLIVFDISKMESFKSLERWINEIRTFTKPEICIVLVGNKSDLNDIREVSKDEAIIFAANEKIPYFEASALEDINVYKVFEELLVAIARGCDPFFDGNTEQKLNSEISQSVKLTLEKKQKKKCCK